MLAVVVSLAISCQELSQLAVARALCPPEYGCDYNVLADVLFAVAYVVTDCDGDYYYCCC